MSDEFLDANPAIRRLWQFDQPAITEHFMRLDPAIRRMRFGGGISPAFMADYAEQIIQIGSIIHGAFPDGVLRAVGELRGLLGEWPMTAEAAFSVEQNWQDRGIGNALVARVVAAAQNRSVKTLYMFCLPENKRMQHLAMKHDAILAYHSGVVEAKLDPPWPTALSIAEEVAGEFYGLAHAVLRWPDRGTEPET